MLRPEIPEPRDTAENDAVKMVHPDDVLLTMIRTADTLGHHLPWANAQAAWSGKTRDLRYAAENLVDAGLIDVTEEGFRLALTCATHPTTPIPPAVGGVS